MMKALRQIARAARRNELAWRYLFNLSPTIAYTRGQPRLAGEQARVLAELKENGIALTTVDKLLGHASLYSELLSEVDALEQEQAEEISRARSLTNTPDGTGKKTFLLELLGDVPVLDPESVYTRFALQKEILEIANGYFGMFTSLRHYNVWRTFASQGEARQSQLWHIDREDHYVLKMFLYLSAVDEGAGPFTYAPGTHPRGRVRRQPAYSMEGHIKRSTDAQMAEVIPPESWIKGVGPKGTILFADTRGFHKGGESRTQDRLLFNCMYVSPSCQAREFFQRVPVPPSQDPARSVALAPPPRRAKSA